MTNKGLFFIFNPPSTKSPEIVQAVLAGFLIFDNWRYEGPKRTLGDSYSGGRGKLEQTRLDPSLEQVLKQQELMVRVRKKDT